MDEEDRLRELALVVLAVIVEDDLNIVMSTLNLMRWSRMAKIGFFC
jgi:hypothetical protein